MIRRPGRQSPAVRPLRPAALRPGARPGGGTRHTRPVRRASAGVTPVRAGALLVILAAGAGIYGLATSGAFAAQRTTVTGATWTPESAIVTALAVPPGTNVFTVRAGDLEQAVRTIPAVSGATVTIGLPDEVRVAVTEREALVRWKVGAREFLVDGGGLLFAELGSEAPEAAAALPEVDDGRAADAALGVGSTLDGVTLDAALRLGSLRPADVGTGARGLLLRVDDEDGFTMRTRPASWTAVFGFYTPTLRSTELIPGQVRLLRSLLAGREDTVARVILADDRSGTYVPVDSPRPSATAKPDRTPKPTRSPKPAATATPRSPDAPTASPQP